MPRPWYLFPGVALLLLASELAANGTAPAPQAAGSASGPPALVEPCAPDSQPFLVAKDSFDAVDEHIHALAPTDDPRAVVEELERLAESPCFELGGRFTENPDSALSLKRYWEAGGREWIDSYLQLGASGGPRWLWNEPSMPRALSRESAPAHPLAALLCRTGDDACIDETRAFRVRASRAFEVQAARSALEDWQRRALDEQKPPPVDLDECEARSKELPRAERFRAFEACLAESEPKTLTFPLVGLKRPKQGWLRISGRRGHYSFCDEQRAYDLATGSAFIVSSCSSLALREGGQVDGRATDGARSLQTRVGTLSREALAELTWFLLISPELQPAVAASGHALPDGIDPVASDESQLGGIGLSWCSSSGDTSLDWSYWLAGRELASGSFTWPGCGLAEPQHYLVGLLEVAELGFQPGCPRATPPPAPRAGRPAVSALDADAVSLSRAERDLDQGWIAALARCGGGKPRPSSR